MQAKGGGAESRILDPGFATEGGLFSLEYIQLLTESKNLKGEVVARTEECAQAGDEADKKWNHEFGFIA